MNLMIEIKNHAQERALERYGIYLDTKELKIMCQLIVDYGNADYLGPGKNNTSVWKIKFKDTWMYPVIDFDQGTVFTFLTKKMAESTVDLYRKIKRREKENVDQAS